MLRSFISFFVGLMLTASSVMAQTTTDQATPATPAGPGTPVTPEATGGLGDWWWLIILALIAAAAIYYFTQKRKPTGRI